jgi:multidrug resistance efflux pump
MNKNRKYIATGIIVLVAALMVTIKWWDYIVNPWTRNGQVRAYVIQLAPRVSGPIVELPIKDNQFVKKGDLLFQIDTRTYALALSQAKSNLVSTGNNVKSLAKQVEAAEASVEVSRATINQVKSSIHQIESQIYTNKREYDRQKKLLPKGSTSQKEVDKARMAYEVSEQQKAGAQASLAQANAALLQSEAALAKAEANLGKLGEENAQIQTALASVHQAELNLEFTSVRAPVDGYVTNLNLQRGSNVVANQPMLALVDANSFWIDGFFKETRVGKIHPGDEAVVTFMSYRGKPVKGYVQSIGWGISQQDGSTGFQMLPNITPTFEWIRLAQRIPVRVQLEDVPDEIKLRVGATCSVLVKTSTSNKEK